MRFRIFVAASVSVAVYLLLNLFFGEHGVFAYRELTAYQARLESNVEEMEETRNKLAERAGKLRSSAEAVALEAREIGYYRDDERPVHVEGFTPWQPGTEAGTLLKEPEPQPNRQPLFRVVALSSGLIAFFLLLL